MTRLFEVSVRHPFRILAACSVLAGFTSAAGMAVICWLLHEED